MRAFLNCVVLLVLSAGLLFPTLSFAAKPPASSTRTYTVMVGLEQPHKGIGVNAYFPATVTVHVGDTVRWVQNSNEIHTVTFLAGTEPAPLIVTAAEAGVPPTPSPLLFNPVAVDPAGPTDGLYDGTTYANSGLMGREPGQIGEYSLTFTAAGTYDYICLVHGIIMSGQVVAVASDIAIPSPNQAMAEGKKQMAGNLAQVLAVVRAASAQIQPPVRNPDGSTTHHVWIGYADGQIDLMRFFPDKLTVRSGDTVVWEMSPQNEVPHTVTFLNGESEPDLVIPVPQPSGPPLLYANPAVFFPQQPSPDLTRDGIYSSGVMDPVPGTTFTLAIGAMTPGLQPYICLLHDSSGMDGVLMVVPQ
jgi:plastocyanin